MCVDVAPTIYVRAAVLVFAGLCLFVTQISVLNRWQGSFELLVLVDMAFLVTIVCCG